MKYKEAFDNLNNNKKWGVSRFPQVLVEILVVSCNIKSYEFLTSWNFGKFWTKTDLTFYGLLQPFYADLSPRNAVYQNSSKFW